MKKKNTQKNNNEKTYKSGEIMSMFENINDGIEIIGEQYKDVANRLDTMQDDVDTIKSDILDIKYDLKDKVSYADFEKMEKRMVKIEKLVFAKLA